jgi:hypothetical protein
MKKIILFVLLSSFVFSQMLVKTPFNENHQFFSLPEKPQIKTVNLKPAGLSLVIPGLGQFINDDDIKAMVFIGIEAVALGSYIYFTNDGNNKRDIMENYADDNFDRIKYYRSLYLHEHGNTDPFDDLFGTEEEQFAEILALDNGNFIEQLHLLENNHGDGSHNLPDSKTQQYYEMIGKYKMFHIGWSQTTYTSFVDYKANGEPRPDYIDTYYKKREAMNDVFKKATWSLTAVFANHMISAFDALISSKNKNYEISVGQDLHQNNFTPQLKWSYNF